MKYTCNNIQINASTAENAPRTNLCKDKKVKTNNVLNYQNTFSYKKQNEHSKTEEWIDEYENADMLPSWVNTILLSISHNNNA
jgi:hypothetical protein